MPERLLCLENRRDERIFGLAFDELDALILNHLKSLGLAPPDARQMFWERNSRYGGLDATVTIPGAPTGCYAADEPKLGLPPWPDSPKP